MNLSTRYQPIISYSGCCQRSAAMPGGGGTGSSIPRHAHLLQLSACGLLLVLTLGEHHFLQRYLVDSFMHHGLPWIQQRQWTGYLLAVSHDAARMHTSHEIQGRSHKQLQHKARLPARMRLHSSSIHHAATSSCQMSPGAGRRRTAAGVTPYARGACSCCRLLPGPLNNSSSSSR